MKLRIAGDAVRPSGDYIDDELPVYQGETTQSCRRIPSDVQVELTPFSTPIALIATSIVDAGR